jgi:hypothetical protein
VRVIATARSFLVAIDSTRSAALRSPLQRVEPALRTASEAAFLLENGAFGGFDGISSDNAQNPAMRQSLRHCAGYGH